MPAPLPVLRAPALCGLELAVLVEDQDTDRVQPDLVPLRLPRLDLLDGGVGGRLVLEDRDDELLV